MRYWTGGALAMFLALLQTSSIEQFIVLGVTPNLLLVLLVCWLVVRGLDDVLPMVAVAGITMGLVGLQTPGLVLLALLPIVALGTVREMHIVHSEAVLVLLLVALASIAYETVLLASVMVTDAAHAGVAFMEVMLPAMIVNLAITPPVYVLMRFARPHVHERRLSY